MAKDTTRTTSEGPRVEPERTSRTQETRAADPVHEFEDTPWVRPSSLEAPPPRDGYVQRWVRVSMGGKDDGMNVTGRMREGWAPRHPDTVPGGFHVPTIQNGQYAGYIGVEGMILCEMPERRNAQRNEYYRTSRERQTASIGDEIARENAQGGSKGFGPITKEEISKPVREVLAAPDE